MTAPALAPLAPAFRALVRDRLRARAAAAGLDGLLVLAPGNVTYATGWHFSVNERPMGLWIPVDGEARLFVPLLELENALDVPGVGVATYDEFPGEVPPVLWMIGETGARRLGIDALEARLLETAHTQLTHLDLADHVRPERVVKHDAELALIREAARFADRVLERLLAAGADIIRQGGTELDLMADATGHARAALLATHGAAFQGTKVGITASVHSGPRAALPHGAVLARQPRPGEPVIAGIGCSLGGYHAESGATFVCGTPSAEQRRVMQAMDESNRATIDALARADAPAPRSTPPRWRPFAPPASTPPSVTASATGWASRATKRRGSPRAMRRRRRPAWSSRANPASTARASTAGAPSRRSSSAPAPSKWPVVFKPRIRPRRGRSPSETPSAMTRRDFLTAATASALVAPPSSARAGAAAQPGGANTTGPARLQLIRNATAIIRYGGKTLLLDPFLSPAGALPAFNNTPNPRPNPLVELPMPAAQVVAGIDATLLTHPHVDHWDPVARELLPKEGAIFVQPSDRERVTTAGFTAVRAVESTLTWEGITIARTGGQHGRGATGQRMGTVSGYVLARAGLPTVYIAGDTIWCPDVADAIRAHAPDVIVVNAGAAQFLEGGLIIMGLDDVFEVCRAAPRATVIAVHLEAVNHCLLTRVANCATASAAPTCGRRCVSRATAKTCHSERHAARGRSSSTATAVFTENALTEPRSCPNLPPGATRRSPSRCSTCRSRTWSSPGAC